MTRASASSADAAPSRRPAALARPRRTARHASPRSSGELTERHADRGRAVPGASTRHRQPGRRRRWSAFMATTGAACARAAPADGPARRWRRFWRGAPASTSSTTCGPPTAPPAGREPRWRPSIIARSRPGCRSGPIAVLNIGGRRQRHVDRPRRRAAGLRYRPGNAHDRRLDGTHTAAACRATRMARWPPGAACDDDYADAILAHSLFRRAAAEVARPQCLLR